MLFTQTIEPGTLELIKQLQKIKGLENFLLVGGTALALYLGHRKSIDIDLFENKDFNILETQDQINEKFKFQLLYTAKNSVKGIINHVIVDIVAHKYPVISPIYESNGIRLISEQDIAAMKINAIVGNGQRSKDFIDIYYLLQKYTLDQIINFYFTKYSQENDTLVLKSLIYFNEVDLSDWPILIINPDLKWKEVRKMLENKVMDYIKKKKKGR